MKATLRLALFVAANCMLAATVGGEKTKHPDISKDVLSQLSFLETFQDEDLEEKWRKSASERLVFFFCFFV